MILSSQGTRVEVKRIQFFPHFSMKLSPMQISWRFLNIPAPCLNSELEFSQSLTEESVWIRFIVSSNLWLVTIQTLKSPENFSSFQQGRRNEFFSLINLGHYTYCLHDTFPITFRNSMLTSLVQSCHLVLHYKMFLMLRHIFRFLKKYLNLSLAPYRDWFNIYKCLYGNTLKNSVLNTRNGAWSGLLIWSKLIADLLWALCYGP